MVQNNLQKRNDAVFRGDRPVFRSSIVKICGSLVGSLIALTATTTPGTAQINQPETQTPQTATVQPSKLRVGITGEPPVLIRSENNELRGVAQEFWRELAEAADLEYEVIPQPSAPEAVDALARGEIDIAMGAIGITPERIARFDFTQPITYDYLTVLLPGSPLTIWDIVKPFFHWVFLSSVGGIWLCLFAVGNLLWLCERRRNSEQFPQSYVKGVREGVWCAIATFTTVGYGDRYPITYWGRIVAGTWAILSLVIVTSLTAGIATTLAIAFSRQPASSINRPEDLKGVRIAAIADSDAINWAEYYRARVTPVQNLSDAIALLEQQQVDGVVNAKLLLEYYLHENPTSPFALANFTFGSEAYGIALPQNSPLIDRLNQQLTKIEMQLQFKEIMDNWFEFQSSD